MIELTYEQIQILSEHIFMGDRNELCDVQQKKINKFYDYMRAEDNETGFDNVVHDCQTEALVKHLEENPKIAWEAEVYISDTLLLAYDIDIYKNNNDDDEEYEDADADEDEDEDEAYENNQIEEAEPLEILFFNPIDIIHETIQYLPELFLNQERLKSGDSEPSIIDPFTKHTLCMLTRGLEKA